MNCDLSFFVRGKVIKTKSVEYMPFLLSLVNFLNGSCWTAYALIRFDLHVTVSVNELHLLMLEQNLVELTLVLPLMMQTRIPNGLGALFGLAQLILYACYYKSPRRRRVRRTTRRTWKCPRSPATSTATSASASSDRRSGRAAGASRKNSTRRIFTRSSFCPELCHHLKEPWVPHSSQVMVIEC